MRFVRGRDENWMIRLARVSREANRIIIQEFQATTLNLGFVRSVALENGFRISSWDEDLVMEKDGGTTSKTSVNRNQPLPFRIQHFGRLRFVVKRRVA